MSSTPISANENKKITPVHTAAINPNAAYLKELCVHAADPNEPDTENWLAGS